MKTIKALDLPDVFLLVQILIFGVTIPTVDTYSDLILSWNLFASGHHLWAVATFLPVLVCFAFTSVAFYQIPFSSPYHRYIGLPVLVLQVDNVYTQTCCQTSFNRCGRNTSASVLPMRSSLARKAGGRSGSTT